MSLVTVENVRILNNPARFSDNFQFEITFECIRPGVKEGFFSFFFFFKLDFMKRILLVRLNAATDLQ